MDIYDSDLDSDELFPDVQSDCPTLGVVMAGIALIIFFIWFFFNAKPEEPKKIWVPGHYEVVQQRMSD